MATNLIVFPPILLAIFLFKKSRPLGGKRRNRIDLGLEEGEAYVYQSLVIVIQTAV